MGLLFLKRLNIQFCIIIALLMPGFSAYCQPDYILPLQKPEKYANRLLGAEKTEDKKFTLPRKLTQGLYTHYNYYFNANNKINAVLERAKLKHRDDYTQLLPFYNFSLENTAADSLELDSVLYKATAGIVLHDLRNSYIDNLYLLIGQAYFYWQKFDSAYRIFQFINYQFFPKGKDEYSIVVGSNDRSANGNLQIATQEKKNIIHKAFSQPPSRNEALLWLAKTYAHDGLFDEAYSLVNLLRKDSYFPERLHPALHEVAAYVFYEREQWDSCAYYLEKALPNASNAAELARWEYLLGQLYSLLQRNENASKFYNKAKVHTTDPVMYIYARLYEAQLLTGTGKDAIAQALKDIIRLAGKERFDGYEDILFYAAAQSAIQLPDTALARNLLQKSIRYNTANPALKNKAFLHLADVSYHQKDYVLSASCYDSLDYQDPSLDPQRDLLEYRKTWLLALVKQIGIVQREDSLQRIAQLPPKELENYLKTLVKQLRKAKGLKEESSENTMPTGNNANTPALLFDAQSKGEWYFGNANFKAKGYTTFKSKWGNRPNVDNWRRQQAIDMNNMANGPRNQRSESSTEAEPAETELTVEGLKKNLPLTEHQLLASNLKIADALFEQAMIYKEKLEDYDMAALTFEELYRRFANAATEEQTLFELYYCYKQTGNQEKANYYKQLLQQRYAGGNYANMLQRALNGAAAAKDEATQIYEDIYNLFIEGKFEKAVAAKKAADEKYGSTYWTPQLLYIESLYHIRQRNDSTAISVLSNIVQQYTGTPMAEKAMTLIEVLNKREEIENYLSTANIVRAEEERPVIPEDDIPTVSKPKPAPPRPERQRTQVKPQPTQPALVKNAPEKKLPPRDTAKTNVPIPPMADTATVSPAIVKKAPPEPGYQFDPAKPHFVLMMLDNVDPIYVSESRNAFMRYNRANHSNENINISMFEFTPELAWLEMGTFADMQTALNYMEIIKQAAQARIIPWLASSKYSFIIISLQNLELLKQKKDIEEYRRFIKQQLPGKF